MALTRAQILARKTGEGETFDLPGGGTVVLRGLTRDEAMLVRAAAENSNQDADNEMISLGMVDPKLSVQDVATWARNDSAGVLVAVSAKISELSGMSEGAGKSRVPRTRRRS